MKLISFHHHILPNEKNIFKFLNLRENDIILYLGGRIDDNNLYPPKYVKYLRDKIKRLNPTKIICHNPWYAQKYYNKGILTKNTKIDIITTYYNYVKGSKLQAIDPTEYSNYEEGFKILADKNPNIIYAVYSTTTPPSSVDIDSDLFGENYDTNNVKYFYYDRRYSVEDLAILPKWEKETEFLTRSRNSSDGFAMVVSLVSAGFRNINILGFSAFGSDEDMSHHSEYICDNDPRFFGKKHFNLSTSESLDIESDIMKYWVEIKKISNIENYNKLMQGLKEK